MMYDHPQREETACACHKCQAMCKHSPCLGTPEEIQELIRKGYGDRLINTEWVDLKSATVDRYWCVAPQRENGACTFQRQDGLCELHDLGLKPMEGRLASCKYPDSGLRRFVAHKWLSVIGVQTFFAFNGVHKTREEILQKLSEHVVTKTD